MDFPAFSSICSSNKAECDVNAVWILCECQSFFCSSCRFVRGILCRWEDEESKGQRDKGTKSQKDKGSKRRRDKKKKGQRDKGSKRRREEETKGREDENRVTSYSCPLHCLFTAQFVQFLFNSCPKTFERFVFQNSTLRNTASWEVGKGDVGGKVGVGGTGKEKAKWE